MNEINRWSDDIDAPENLPIQHSLSDELWVQRDGTIIRVGDMTDEHVYNCYNMLLQNDVFRWIKIFATEIRKRGITNEQRKIQDIPRRVRDVEM